MREHELPERWRTRVVEYAKNLSFGKYSSLGASAFGNQGVRLGFPDGSSVSFRHAFYIKDEAAQEVAVFSEHCGYHVFPLTDTAVETIEPQELDG